jgi:3-keto-disaccharide hydrolase
MKRALFAALAVAVLSAQAGADDAPKGFESLFNGKDLTGWKATGKKEVWDAESGILILKGGGGGWLMTDKQYADFDLRLEYRFPQKMTNSGVGIRAPLKGDPAYQGMEIQLIDDVNWKGLKPTQNSGAIYDVQPPAKIANKPIGEWNAMRIVAKGRKVKVELNGTVLVDADLDSYKDHFKKHPGLERKDGHIGLQSYNYRVEFRKIFLKPL